LWCPRGKELECVERARGLDEGCEFGHVGDGYGIVDCML
jgi:hypothetical protein